MSNRVCRSRLVIYKRADTNLKARGLPFPPASKASKVWLTFHAVSLRKKCYAICAEL